MIWLLTFQLRSRNLHNVGEKIESPFEWCVSGIYTVHEVLQSGSICTSIIFSYHFPDFSCNPCMEGSCYFNWDMGFSSLRVDNVHTPKLSSTSSKYLPLR